MKAPSRNSQLKLPKNFTVNIDFDVLATSGNINHGFVLSIGDKITFPDSWDETLSGFTEIGKSANKFKAWHIGVLYNEKERLMPMGSIRRNPYNALEALKDYPTNLELIEMVDDRARLTALFGKTLKVVDVKEFDFTVYDSELNESKRNEDGSLMLKKQKIAIFEYI